MFEKDSAFAQEKRLQDYYQERMRPQVSNQLPGMEDGPEKTAQTKLATDPHPNLERIYQDLTNVLFSLERELGRYNPSVARLADVRDDVYALLK